MMGGERGLDTATRKRYAALLVMVVCFFVRTGFGQKHITVPKACKDTEYFDTVVLQCETCDSLRYLRAERERVSG